MPGTRATFRVLISEEVVDYDLNLLLGPAETYYLTKRVDELLTGVPPGCLAMDLTGPAV
jgi:hypothetical protein